MPFFFFLIPGRSLFCLFLCLPASLALPGERESGCISVWPRPRQCTDTAWHREGMDWQCLYRGKGSKNRRDPEGCSVLWTMGWGCLCRERNTGDGASGGRVRAREGET